MKTKELPPKSVLQPSATDASFDRTAGSSSAPPPLQLHVDDSLSTSALGTVQREEMPEEEELQMKADTSIQREAEEEEELQMKSDESIQRMDEEEELMM